VPVTGSNKVELAQVFLAWWLWVSLCICRILHDSVNAGRRSLVKISIGFKRDAAQRQKATRLVVVVIP